MRRGWLPSAGLVALLALATPASIAEAQPPPPVGDEFGAPPPASTPAVPAAQDAPSDEPDPEADPGISFALAFVIGVATQERFDRVLAALGYEESGAVFGGDAAVMLPLAPWLWLGGRAVLRSRNWARSGGEQAAHAFGAGLLLTIEARAAAGDVLGFSFGAGAGGGPISMRIGEGVESPLAPAASAYVRITTRVGEGAHLFGRFEYAFFEAANLRDTDLDVSLNGVTFGFGMEVRR